MTRIDRYRLEDILECIALIDSTVAHGRRMYDESPVVRAAIERWLITMGTAASCISEHHLAQNPDLDLRAVVGLRNRLVHAYQAIDHELVWAVCTVNVTELADTVERILTRIRDSE